MCTRIIKEHAENICLAIRDFLFQFDEQTPFERAPLFAPYEDYVDKDEPDKSDKPVFEQELKEIVVIKDSEPVVTEIKNESECSSPTGCTGPTSCTGPSGPTDAEIISYFENLEKPTQPLAEPIENPIIFEEKLPIVINKPIYINEEDDWDII